MREATNIPPTERPQLRAVVVTVCDYVNWLTSCPLLGHALFHGRLLVIRNVGHEGGLGKLSERARNVNSPSGPNHNVADAHWWRAATATESDEHEVSRMKLIKLGSFDAGQQATGSPARVAGHLADAAGRVVAERQVVSEGGKVAAVEACM
jgi:hypothetical protein